MFMMQILEGVLLGDKWWNQRCSQDSWRKKGIAYVSFVTTLFNGGCEQCKGTSYTQTIIQAACYCFLLQWQGHLTKGWQYLISTIFFQMKLQFKLFEEFTMREAKHLQSLRSISCWWSTIKGPLKSSEELSTPTYSRMQVHQCDCSWLRSGAHSQAHWELVNFQFWSVSWSLRDKELPLPSFWLLFPWFSSNGKSSSSLKPMESNYGFLPQTIEKQGWEELPEVI